MKSAIFLAIVFMIAANIESSMLWTFPWIVGMFPLVSILGFVVLYRFGIPEGVAWFLALAFMRMDVAALIIAGLAPLLLQRVFVTRSLYALLGVSALSMACGLIGASVVCTVASWFGGVCVPSSFAHSALAIIFVMLGVYGGFVLVRSFDSFVRARA